MSIFSGVNNPGLGFLQLTAGEIAVITQITGLGDPGADRILFWDESANSYAYLTAGTGLTITDTTITADAGATPTAITVADTTDSTSFVALFESATGDLGPKTDAGITYNASTGVLTATGFSGPLTGNVTGNASTVTIADAANDTTTFPLLGTAATGSLAPATDSDLTYNANTGALAALLFTANTITANTAFVPDANDGAALGVSGTAFSDLFLAAGGVIDWIAGDVTLTGNTASLTFAGGDFFGADGDGLVWGHTAQLVADGITPEFQIIGTSTTGVDSSLLIANYSTTATSPALLILAKSDQGTPGSFALLDSGDTIGGIHWVADDGVDLTSVAASIMAFVDGTSGSNDMPGRLVFATAADGAAVTTDRWIIDSAGALKPAADGSFDIGTTTLAVNNLHLDTGATINFENGNAVITHSSAILTVSTGDLRVTSAGANTASVVTVGGTQTLTNKTLTAPIINAATVSGTITLAESTSIALDPAQTDQTWTGITRTGTAGAALAFGQLIYLAVADSRWELADADALATAGNVLIGMCVLAAAGDASATNVLLMGNIQAASQFPTFTVGAAVYAGETAGAVQVAIPTGADNVIRVVGFALTADELYFNPSQDHQTTVA